MVIRIRLERGRPMKYKSGKNRKLSLAAGGLLVPFATIAYRMGVWRLAADMGAVAGLEQDGLWSHWQVWLPLGVLFHVCASTFTRYGLGGDLSWPRVLSPRVMSPAPETPEPTVLDLSRQ